MTKFITLLIGFSLAFAAVAQAKRAEQENPKNKKSQPVQKQQVAPKQQQVAPKQQPGAESPGPGDAQAAQGSYALKARDTLTYPPRFSPTAPKLRDNARVRQTEGTQQNLTTLPPQKDSSLADGRFSSNTLPAVQSNKLKVNKTVKTFQPRHQNFQAKVNPSVASVRFNQDFRIRNAENWRGAPLQRLQNLSPPMARPELVALKS